MAIDLLRDITLGLDSLVLCIGVGAAWRARLLWLPPLAGLFGAADGGALLLGRVFGPTFQDPLDGLSAFCPLAIAGYGCLVLLASARISSIASRPCMLVALSLLLSIDNLVAGASSIAALGDVLAGAGLSVAVTAAMALTGCCIGLTSRAIPLPPRIPIGASALAASLIAALG